jgi:hypothetical protein
MSTPAHEFPVYEIPCDAGKAVEQMGSKEKFWLWWGPPGESECQWLFKYSRLNDGVMTGEHWSEKLGAEAAAWLGLRHARVELAASGGRPGVLCQSFLGHSPGTALVHGNELLGAILIGYDSRARFHHAQHTFEAVRNCLERITAAEHFHEAMTDFCGLMVLDALILNTDRHHVNWGVLLGDGPIRLAPTYDHASSLGRELLPERRQALLAGGLGGYLSGGKGGLFRSTTDRRGANPLELCLQKMREHPPWFAPWQERLRGGEPKELFAAVDRVPRPLMEEDAKRLAKEIIRATMAAVTSNPT